MEGGIRRLYFAQRRVPLNFIQKDYVVNLEETRLERIEGLSKTCKPILVRDTL